VRSDSRPLVLIVDDEEHVVSGLCRMLRKEPYDLVVASDAEQALEQLRKHEVDVIVADEGLPGTRGTALLTFVRDTWPEVMRIMLTGDTHVEVAQRAINEGQVYRFFVKPCGEHDLVFGIRDALELQSLRRESTRMLGRFRKQRRFLETLEDETPEIFRVRRDRSGAVLVDPEDLPEDAESLLEQIRLEIREADSLEVRAEMKTGRREDD